ncbi:MAG: hypothetical protein KC478_17780 [Bacteriovoracaceae bacterium]|nr:hypothetical protein [Bacteriovoracaceae bacterium]
MKIIIYSILSVIAAVALYSAKNEVMPVDSVKSLNLALSHPIKSFDPAIAFNDDSLTVIGQSLETLYQYHYLKRPYEVIPALAKDMPKISKDGKTYTITIKDKIAYSPSQGLFEGKTRYVQAQDFVNQIKRLAFTPLKSTGAWLFSGKIKGPGSNEYL